MLSTSVHREGQGKQGLGKITTETGALAACFAMAFSFGCDRAGLATRDVDTQASVRLVRQGECFVIDQIALKMQATVRT